MRWTIVLKHIQKIEKKTFFFQIRQKFFGKYQPNISIIWREINLSAGHKCRLLTCFQCFTFIFFIFNNFFRNHFPLDIFSAINSCGRALTEKNHENLGSVIDESLHSRIKVCAERWFSSFNVSKRVNFIASSKFLSQARVYAVIEFFFFWARFHKVCNRKLESKKT